MNTLFDKLSPYFNLASRLLLALIFIVAGYGKIGGYSGTQGYMEAMGVPGALLPLVIVVELGGGLLPAALFHHQPADQMQMIMFMKNLAITGGLLLVTQYGAGAFAVDKHR